MIKYIKENWSEQYRYDDEDTDGFFVGREQEVRSLGNILLNNSSSSVLVSSVRGVGKTSFIHKVVGYCGDKVTPIFVNIGSALETDLSPEEKRRKLLTNLIRATKLSIKRPPKDINELYEKTLGKYTEHSSEDSSNEKSNETHIQLDFLTILGVIGLIISSVIPNLYVRTIILALSLGVTGFSYSHTYKSWKKNASGNSHIQENSNEYLEIEFEKWLKKYSEKNKLVFIIDELDQFKETDSFPVIKKYKNLFSSSNTHFIFIAGHEAFTLAQGNREASVDDGGIIPTLFTHVYYLPRPSSSEIRKFLLNIIIDVDENNADEEELIDYLLFRSKSDFFNLKKVITNVLTYDEEGKPFIDTETIKRSDKEYSNISKLYGLVDNWFIQRELLPLQKDWKQNTDMQKDVYNLLNDKFDNPPIEDSAVKGKKQLEGLIKFLLDTKVIQEQQGVDTSGQPDPNKKVYVWTNNFERDKKAPMTDKDKLFRESFRSLIEIANDLQNLPKGDFKKADSIIDGQDGRDISGVNLFSTFSSYKDLYERIGKPNTRIRTSISEVDDGYNAVQTVKDSIQQNTYNIFNNLIEKHLVPTIGNIHPERDVANYPNAFALCKDFNTKFQGNSKLYFKEDKNKAVLVMQNFNDFEEIQDGLTNLKDQTNLLVVNLISGVDKVTASPKIIEKYTDTAGRNRKREVSVDNYKNYSIKNIPDLYPAFSDIQAHLS